MPKKTSGPSRRAAMLSSIALGGGMLPAVAAAQARDSRRPRGTMRVYELGEQKSFETLRVAQRPVPTPGPGQALIRVHYAGIAARDQGIATAQFPVPPGPRPATLIPLSEGAGEVIAVGSGESRIAVGDRVTATHWANWVTGPWTPDNYKADVGNTIDGWLGEYVLLPTQALAKIPDGLSFEHAATLAGSGATIWHALHEVARVRSDDTVLSLGTGGVSSFGVLLAKAAGARVVVTSSSDEKLAEMRKLGADITVNYRANPQWGREVFERTKGAVSVVLENVGPATLEQSMAACGNNARIVLIGTGRPPPNPPNIYGMYMKNLSLKAISAGSREMVERLMAALVNTGVRPVIARQIPFDSAVEAYAALRDGDHLGKIVIKVS